MFLVSRLRLSDFAALVAIAFGACVFAGWQFRIPWLRGVAAGTFVAPNTAACFIVCGIALWLNRRHRNHRISQFLSLLVGTFALATLLEILLRTDFGIDGVLLTRKMAPDWTIAAPLGRFAWPTALSFVLVSLALFLQQLGGRAARFAEILASMSILTAFLSIMGRLYSAKEFYGYRMSPLVSLMFLVFGLGVILAGQPGAIVSAFRSTGPGGILARRLLFITLTVIPVLGYLRLMLFRRGIGEFEFGTALLIIAIIMVLIPMILRTAFELDRSDALRQKTAQALLQAEKLAATGRFAALIAHEINNPLEAVTNLLYLANTNPAPKQKEFIELAEKELARVAHLTKLALGFYRDKGHPQSIEVSTLVDEVSDLLQFRWKRAGVTVANEILSGLKVFAIDGEIRQILSNLMVNAADASLPGQRVTLRAQADNVHCHISVVDEGCGIPNESLPRIFQPFFTTKAMGNGLGLWVTSELVAKNGGTVTVSSSVEPSSMGTTFTIKLPRHTENNGPTATDSASLELQTVLAKHGSAG